jgi:hypothetical protein
MCNCDKNAITGLVPLKMKRENTLITIRERVRESISNWMVYTSIPGTVIPSWTALKPWVKV